MKIMIEFNELREDGTSMPQFLDIEIIEKIDYGNFGDENHRHHWPGWHIRKDYNWRFPVCIIYTNNGQGKFCANSSIRFHHY